MDVDTYLVLLRSLLPTKVVLVLSFERNLGLPLAALRYNDERFGLTQCPLVCFHPGGAGNIAKAHFADHSLDRVMRAYQRQQDEHTNRAAKRALQQNPSAASAHDLTDTPAEQANLGGTPAEQTNAERM